MRLSIHIIFFIYILYVSFVIIFNLRGNIAFGQGLGDLYYLIILTSVTLLAVVFYILIIKKKYSKTTQYIYVIYLLLVVVFSCIKLTILRGPEYPWNGKFFLD